jgi:hypothetical protein
MNTSTACSFHSCHRGDRLNAAPVAPVRGKACAVKRGQTPYLAQPSAGKGQRRRESSETQRTSIIETTKQRKLVAPKETRENTLRPKGTEAPSPGVCDITRIHSTASGEYVRTSPVINRRFATWKPRAALTVNCEQAASRMLRGGRTPDQAKAHR